MKVSLADVKALRQRFGGTLADAKRALDEAEGDLDVAALRFAAVVRAKERRKQQSNEGVVFADLEATLSKAIEEASSDQMHAVWEQILPSLVDLVDGPEVEHLVDVIIDAIEKRSPDFDFSTTGPWAGWFMDGVPDSRLRLFRSLGFGGSDMTKQAADNWGAGRILEGLPYLDEIGAHLEHVALSGMRVGDAHFRLLADLELPSIASLNLSLGKCDAATLERLSEATWMPRLQSLHVSSSMWREQPKDRLSFIARATSVRRLIVSGGSYLDGIAIPRLPLLEELQVRSQELRGLEGLPSTVERLRLSGALFTPEVVDAIAGSSIRELALIRCGSLTDGRLTQDAHLIDMYNDQHDRRRKPKVLDLRSVRATIVVE